VPPRSCLVLALLCACAPDAPDTSDAPDAGTTERALTAALAAGGALGEAVPIDETKVIPYPWSLDIHTTAFHGGRHYVLATEWLAVLDGDGIPVDRRRFAFGPYESVSDADLAVSDDRLAVAHESDGFLRLHIIALEGGLPGPVIADVAVHPTFPVHWMHPQVLFGGGMIWIVYEHPPSSRPSETSTIAARRFTLDGTPLDDAPITIAAVLRVTAPQATFGGGHLYVGWAHQGGDGYVARLSPEGRVDRQPRALRTGPTTFVNLAANDRGVLVAIDGAAYRLDHDLGGGAPFVFSPSRVGASVLRTRRGFRLVWPTVDTYQYRLRDIPDGAPPDAEIAPADVEFAGFPTVDDVDRTILVYEGYGDQLSHALRLGADGAVEARDIPLRDTMRADYGADLVVSGDRRLLRWTRSTGSNTDTRVQAMLTPDAAIVGAPAPALPGDLHPRAGGFWQHQGTTVQALDGDLQPVGAAIAVAADSRLTPLGASALVTWQDSGGLHGQRIEAGPVGAPLLISASPFYVSASAASAETWLLVGCDSAGVRVIRVAASGAILPPLTIPASAPCTYGTAAVAHDGGAFTIAWSREVAGRRWEDWTTRLVDAVGL
jgi:hypothetical protein